MKKAQDHLFLTNREIHLLTKRVELSSKHRPLPPFSHENTQTFIPSEIERLAKKAHALTGETWAICDLLSSINEREAESDLLDREEGQGGIEGLPSIEITREALESALKERGLVAIPKWALKPIFGKMMDFMTLELKQSKGKGTKARAEQKVRKNRQHYLRYLLVEKWRKSEKLSIENASGEAADASEGTFIDGAESTFRNSHRKVTRELKEGSLSYYLPVSPNVRNHLSRIILSSD